MSETSDTFECPYCGAQVWPGTHVERCRERVFDGTCPMCGEEYKSYTEHIRNCEA
jgi:predicted RNA-binding Zn-ribbon protein involved in translation (DUF1610 family)